MDNGSPLGDMLPLLAAGAVLVVLALLVGLALRGQGPRFPYARKPLLTPAERRLWDALCLAAPGGTVLLAKVRLADFLSVEERGREYLSHFGRISQKHTDFLLVDEETFEPLLAVELDDSTHRTLARTRESDRFKNAAYAAAGLPILRIAAARNYDAAALGEAVAGALRGESEPE